MSRLEVDSVDVLTPLIVGLDHVELLSLSQQRQIALWATKTAMMVDQTQADPILSYAQRSRLRTHRAIPGGTRVWIGACDAMNPIVTSHTVRIDLQRLDDPETPPPVSFYTPLKIGRSVCTSTSPRPRSSSSIRRSTGPPPPASGREGQAICLSRRRYAHPPASRSSNSRTRSGDKC